ncbi:hypothetical protein BDZ94DRAFT_1159467 [Collybia nuda]|uniref:Ankyrin repeat protein n=1 Tax=Collybia nuda TaxID=64659 RepID=A0A9P5YBI7_9AGAR|nr:hypothetical protein BDZ94DRAFT_1159467 [Collybia nuda]
MSIIYDEALNGTLTADGLKEYLNSDPTILDTAGGSKQLTPLAAACSGGHLGVVELLLAQKANPNAPSAHSRTPFFFAATLPIVQVLINGGADVNLVCDDDQNTPLINAILQLKDKDIARLLVDNKASLTQKNKNGDTAESLAKKHGMAQSLKPKGARNSIRARVVDAIMSMVLMILAYANSLTAKATPGGAVKKLYGIQGVEDGALAKEIPEPKSVDDFKQNLNGYISKDKTLQRFFARNDPFLQNLAEKASKLTDDPTTDLGKPENINNLTRLSLYRTVIYLDDSGSMKTGTRFADQKELVTRIARIATKIVPEDYAGVDLHFINSSNSSSKLDEAAIAQAIDKVQPRGGTKIGTNLRSKILDPLVYQPLAAADPSKGSVFKQPLLVCTITDGDPTQEDVETLQNAIVECKKALVNAGYEATAVMFCVSQIGSDPAAKVFLDGLRENPRLKQVLYCTTDQLDGKFQQMQANEKGLESWLLHLLTGPIMQRDEE